MVNTMHDTERFLAKIENHTGAFSTAEIGAFISEIVEIISQPDPGEVEVIFEKADVSRIAPVMLIALLRTTFSVRLRLSNWQIFRDRVRDQLDDLGLESAKVLRGLY